MSQTVENLEYTLEQEISFFERSKSLEQVEKAFPHSVGNFGNYLLNALLDAKLLVELPNGRFRRTEATKDVVLESVKSDVYLIKKNLKMI